MPERILKGLCTVQFKTGGTTQGDLSEYIWCEDSEAVKRILTDPDFWADKGDREFDLVNLAEVSFVHVGSVRIQTP